jgi:hypothetical protein
VLPLPASPSKAEQFKESETAGLLPAIAQRRGERDAADDRHRRGEPRDHSRRRQLRRPRRDHHGPTNADKNLGLKYFLNGALVSDIAIDATQVATDTVQYVATDPTGLTATSTRTVLIEAPVPASALLSSPSSPTASSTQAIATSTTN